MSVVMLPINNFSTKYSDNICPSFMTFDKPIPPSTTGDWNVVSGSGLVSTGVKMMGENSLTLVVPNTNVDFEINSPGNTDTYCYDSECEKYLFQITVMDLQTNLSASDDFLKIKVYLESVLIETLVIKKSQVPEYYKQYTFFYPLTGYYGDSFSFAFVIPQTTIPVFSAIAIDGFKLELNNKNQSYPSAYSYPSTGASAMPTEVGDYQLKVTDATFYKEYTWKKILLNSDVLNFPNTVAGSYNDLTVPLSGAVVGDIVEMGTTVILTGGRFNAFVSAPNIVTIRFTNDTTSAIAPPAGTFKIKIQ